MTDHGPVPDPKHLLSGHPAEEKLIPVKDKSILKNYVLFNQSLTTATGPWGTSFSANLTPDETGLGEWNFGQFEKAMREGKYKGLDNGRMLLPPMPWPGFSKLSNQDLHAIWAYLQSIPAVKNEVPAPIPPTPVEVQSTPDNVRTWRIGSATTTAESASAQVKTISRTKTRLQATCT